MALKTPWPSNRDDSYSDSMKGLLKNGYKAKLRPSGHDITINSKDNGASIPPNLIAIATLKVIHLTKCKEKGIKPHPARFPLIFLNFLFVCYLDKGDLVFKSSGGSA